MSRLSRLWIMFILFLFPLMGVPAQEEGGGGEASYRAGIEQYRIILEEDYIPTEEEIESLRSLVRDLNGTLYIELTNEARMLLAIGEEKLSSENKGGTGPLSFELKPYPYAGNQVSPRQAAGLGITLGTGIVSLGLFNAFSFLSNVAYERYVTTTTASSAALLQRTWMLYDLLKYIFLGTGVVSFGAAIPIFLSPGEYAGMEEFSREGALKTRMLLEKRLIRGETNSGGWETTRDMGLGIGITNLTGTTLAFVLAEIFHDRYSRARFSEDAELMREKVSLLETFGISMGSAAAAGILTAALSAAIPADTEMIEYKIDALDVGLAMNGEGEGDVRREYLKRRLADLREQRADLQKRLLRARESQPAFSALTFTSLGIGAASLAGMGVSIIFGLELFEEYNNQLYSADASETLKRLNAADTAACITGIVGTLGIGTSVLTALFRPNEQRLMRELERMDRTIEEYSRQLEEPGLLF